MQESAKLLSKEKRGVEGVKMRRLSPPGISIVRGKFAFTDAGHFSEGICIPLAGFNNDKLYLSLSNQHTQKYCRRRMLQTGNM